MTMHADEVPIDAALVRRLLAAQHPRWAGLDPVPSRWIVDGAGVLRDVFDDPDYTSRPEPAETVAKLRVMM